MDKILVMWSDWGEYHAARFRALVSHPIVGEMVIGVEIVGGTGTHSNFPWRFTDRDNLPLTTLFPASNLRDLGLAKIAGKVWRYLNLVRPRVVVVPGYATVPALTTALWGRIGGARTILMTESTSIDHERNAAKEIVKKALVKLLFDCAIVGGCRSRAYAEKLGIDPARIGLFHNVVGNREFEVGCADIQHQRQPSSYGLPEKYFLFVGRLAPEKNVNGLLAAFAAYRERGGAWDLVIVGDGPLSPDVRASAARIAGVTMVGFRRGKELLPYYAFASCFVLPSTREPWGLVVNEAMASGLPVLVSSACGCVEDLVAPDRNGWIFNASDKADLCGLLCRMEALSEAEREAFGLQSREIIGGFTPDKFASEIVRLTCL